MTLTIETITEADAYIHAFIKAQYYRASATNKALMKVVNLTIPTIAIDNANAAVKDANITHNFEPATTASLYALSSSNVDTGQDVYLIVLDASGDIVTKTITLTDDTGGPGGTPTEAAATACGRLLHAYILTACTGNITISNTGQTEVYGYIAAGALESEHAWFVCPTGKTMYVAYFRPFINDAPLVGATGETVVFTILVDGVVVASVTVSSLASNQRIDLFPIVTVEAGESIEVKADCSEVAGVAGLQLVAVIV